MRELRRRIQTTRSGRARRRVELVADEGIKDLSPDRQAKMSTFCLNLSNYELKPTREERYTNASQSADQSERNLREAETTLIQATAAFDTMDGDESVITAVRESLEEQQKLVDALAELAKVYTPLRTSGLAGRRPGRPWRGARLLGTSYACIVRSRSVLMTVVLVLSTAFVVIVKK